MGGGVTQGAALEARDGDGRTPLMHAAAAGHAHVVEALLAAGARLEAKEDGAKGRTALTLAAAAGHVHTTLTLLDAGADAEARDADGRTAVWVAAAAGRVEVDGTAELLLRRLPFYGEERVPVLEVMHHPAPFLGRPSYARLHLS
jgi:ankyrin repeat protein